MYLKRLELYGFKSFAAKTSFDFGQGLTAIVGPNGSGKSNIADALRWVLGEASGRLIRAKKLEDVIYAGSEKRGRADKVEVTMVLDNSTGWLPVDVDEVHIMRRGSRNGDSDYFLNGRRAKLREIQQILATASVSQNSYAIIGQGLVESVLNLRPEDKREMIEEAADIQRYRYKIEEAEQRVRQTHENIERVKLLVKEIAPRMNALERQAKRAGEHAELTSQLQQALREYYEHRWSHAHEALTVARAGHDQAQAEFIQARVAVETVQRELDGITAELEESRQVAAASLAEKERVDGRIREIERRVAVARERRTMLQARQEELREELVAIQAEQERATAVIGSGDDDRERAEAAVEAARKVVKERQVEISAMEAEFREAHLHAADADARAKRLQSVAGEMKGRIRRLTEAGEASRREIDRLENRRRSVIHQMTEHVRVLRGLRTQDTQLLAEAGQTGVRRAALEAEVQGVRDALSAVEAGQNSRRGKLEGLEARLKVLAEAQAQAAGDPEEGITIEGAVATIYEVLRVPRGLEEAIAAVLADQIDAFIFERQGEAVAAIESLVEQNGPRSIAIPLDAMKQVYPLSLMKEKGVLGVAAQLVRYPPEIREADEHAPRAASLSSRTPRRPRGCYAAVSGRSSRSTGSSSTRTAPSPVATHARARRSRWPTSVISKRSRRRSRRSIRRSSLPNARRIACATVCARPRRPSPVAPARETPCSTAVCACRTRRPSGSRSSRSFVVSSEASWPRWRTPASSKRRTHSRR